MNDFMRTTAIIKCG